MKKYFVLVLLVLLLVLAGCADDVIHTADEEEYDEDNEEYNSDSEGSSSDILDAEEAYYYGWVLHEWGDYEKSSTVTEHTTEFSTLYLLKLKNIEMAPTERWFYIEEAQIFDVGSEEYITQDPCGEFLTASVNKEVDRFGSGFMSFDNPEDFHVEAYAGYLNLEEIDESGEYRYNLAIVPSPEYFEGKETIVSYSAKNVETAEGEYACVVDSETTTKDYSLGEINIGDAYGDSEKCEVDYTDETLVEPVHCPFYTSDSGNILKGDYFDGINRDGQTNINEVDWLSVEWHLQRRDCGNNCGEEEDLYYTSKLDIDWIDL